jgi:hypothetical protein
MVKPHSQTKNQNAQNQNNNTQENNSTTQYEKELKQAHDGKIDHVPWESVKAYLVKYKGVGRLQDRYLKAKSFVSKTATPNNNNNNNHQHHNNSNFKSKSNIEMMDYQDNNTTSKINPIKRHRNANPQHSKTTQKRKGGSFYPLDSDEDLSSSDYEDFEPIGIHDSKHPDDYAPRLANLFTNHIEPNHLEFDTLSQIGQEKINLHNLEMQLASRAQNFFTSPEAMQLFDTRYDQLMIAQTNAAEPVQDFQGGIFTFDTALESFLINAQEAVTLNLQQYDEYMTMALSTRKYASAFFIFVVSCLERNLNFDMAFAVYFTNAFSQYLANFITASNADYMCDIIFKTETSIDACKNFVDTCYYACDVKRETITRQIQVGSINGNIPACITDEKLSTILGFAGHMRSLIGGYIQELTQSNSLVSSTTSALSSLKGKGIAKHLTQVRNKISVNHLQNLHDKKFGGSRGQELAQQPSPIEISMLNAHKQSQSIAQQDHNLRFQKQVLIAEIDRFKIAVQDTQFVNLVPLDDFQNYLKFSLKNSTPTINGNEPCNILAQFTGEDVWLNQVSMLTSGSFNIELEQKILLCQGYVSALRVSEYRCESILKSLMRRLGTDPLAPKIITREMHEIFLDLGYYVEENVGLVQAYDQLSVKSKKTEQMDRDLAEAVLQQQQDPNSSYINCLLDSIISNFQGPTSANGQSNDEFTRLTTLVCAACNKIYAQDSLKIPITLPCGDVQCLTCSVNLKQCFKCKTEAPNLPDTPKAYNPTLHYPVDFIGMKKLNAASCDDYLTFFLLSNNPNGSFSKDQAETIAYLNQIQTELLMASGTASKNIHDKERDFFADIIQCQNTVQLLKITIGQLTSLDLEACKNLVGRALVIADFYAGANETRFLIANVISAVVGASRLPMQGLLCQALLDNNSQAMFAYCSAQNIKLCQEINDSRKNFKMYTHAFMYNDVAPLALDLVVNTLEILSSEEFDNVLATPTRLFLMREFQEAHVFMQEACKAQNFSGIQSKMSYLFQLFFNELAIYLKPIASMSEAAVSKCDMLYNLFTDSRLSDMAKKYEGARDVEVDPFMIDLKYSEIMLNEAKSRLDEMYDFTITSASTALSKEAEFNEAVKTGSMLEAGRMKLNYPGLKFDIPTVNSAYKNLPPLICSVNQDTLGNNPALPLYQFMMTTGTLLDNPYSIMVPQQMELSHTEGRLFYTGYDGFLEEYAPQTFDPTITDSSGTVLVPDRIVQETNRVATTGRIVTERQVNLPKPPHMELIEMLKAERQAAQEQLKTTTQSKATQYSDMFKTVVKNDIFKSFVIAQFGPQTYQYISKFQDTYDAVAPYLQGENTPSNIANKVYNTVATTVGNAADSLWTDFKNIPNTLSNMFAYGGNMHNSGKLSGGSIKGYFKSKQHMLAEHLKHRHQKVMQDTDPMKILEPVLNTLSIGKIRKNVHDVHDTHVTQHRNKHPIQELNETAPYCGHCGSRGGLRSLTKEPIETVCEPCFVGKGITKNRKIINQHNSESLATSTHPALSQMSACYNDFVNHINHKQEPVLTKHRPLPANEHWEHIKNTAKPYFRQDPETLIRHYANHKISEPLPDNLNHLLKTTALIGGRLHSMMQTEIESQPHDHYENLKHNYLWHIAHLPKGGNRPLAHNNIIRHGMGFNDIAREYEQSRDNVRMLANTFV